MPPKAAPNGPPWNGFLALLPAPPHSTLTLFSNTDRITILPTATMPRLGRTGECPRLVKPNKDETLVRVTQVAQYEDKS